MDSLSRDACTLFFTKSLHRIFFGVLLFFFTATFLFFPETFSVIVQTFSDAYIGVSVFVGLVFLLFFGVEYLFNIDTARFFRKNQKWHVPISAFLGVLPGCGGAIMVITQFVAGRIGFGSVVAVLTSTMGDAAFLLLAQRPFEATILFGISFVAGTIFGFLVEKIHGPDFLRQKSTEKTCFWEGKFRFGMGEKLWMTIFIPGLVLAFCDAFHVPVNEFFGFEVFQYFGFFAGLLSLILWGTSPYASPKIVSCRENISQLLGQVIFDTNFVFVWVLVAFLAFELPNFWFSFSIEQLFSGSELFLPLVGVLIGFLPGCGPQILVTAAYISGAIPFSAQVANAISNDGDALFPAIALAPRVALYATLYTSIPALLIGYGWMFFFE